MLLSQVRTTQGEEALRVRRREDYRRNALEFLEKTFPDDMATCSLSEKNTFIEFAYTAALRRDLRRERDLLQYLSVTVYWGIAFETDPQHRPALVWAGWLNKDGSFRKTGDFDALFAAVNRWSRLTQCECENGSDLLKRVRRAMEAGDNVESTAGIRRLLSDIWPDRMGVLSDDAQNAIIDTALQHARELKVKGRDMILYSALGIHLGYWFHNDPHYADLGRILRMTGSETDRRVALGKAILDRWRRPEEDKND